MTAERITTSPGPHSTASTPPHRGRAVLASLALAPLCLWSVPGIEASTTATLLPSGDAIELTGEGAGNPFKTTIPVHRSGAIRYFSAGVGMEERQAVYPPFPLKLILVAGPKAYLSRAGVTITNAEGSVRLDIPSEHVDGPWLFVDLPSGTYDITANSEGTAVEHRGVRVTAGTTSTVYLRWPRGPELF